MVRKTRVTKQLEFPLIEQSRKLRIGDLFEEQPERDFMVPDYVTYNLKHQLRDYQAEALFNLNWTQKIDQVSQDYRHLMFNMATGSGKTDLMAGITLYMYGEFGYQNFMFVANSNAVVTKTRDNFLNDASTKYLFKAPLIISGRRIEIRAVSRFPLHPDEDVIYFKLTTIQSLANELGMTRENGLTYDDLAKRRIVVLADEAHHFNANTKAEKRDEHSWETLLDNVRNTNPDNRQFEFTATIDVDKEEVYEKYKNKIIYKYELNQFMNDGFSKNVYRLESNNDDQTKMMNAVLLSQYRKRVAKNHGIVNFKPVILFKSNLVKKSGQARDAFVEKIETLTVAELQQFITDHMEIANSRALSQAYQYWLEQDFSETVAELKRDFQRQTIINVNDTDKEGVLGDSNDFDNLNTLEDPNNPFRVIFAVAKLTEGWDVLNLFDIVRLGEQPVTEKQTNREAQLIGRGARYYPFKYHGEQSFVRRFDQQDKELSLLESLYYHTTNDVKYITNLHKSFNRMNLVSESDNNDDYEIYTATVKPAFKRTRTYKYGNLYHNQLEDVPAEEYNNIGSYGVSGNEITVDMNSSTRERYFDAEAKDNDSELRLIANFDSRNDQRLINKAIARDPFFRFNTIKKYVPVISSMAELLHNKEWLGKLSIRANVAINSPSLTMEDRCQGVQKALAKIAKDFQNNYQRQRGTNRFEPIKVSEVIQDYQKRISQNKTGTTADIRPLEMTKKKWYVYDEAVVDGLERKFINMIGVFIDENHLQEKYDQVYLLRNEETLGKLKLYEYQPNTEVRHYQGYMPDFILYVGNDDFQYQIYTEPKGRPYLTQDSWKQDLLENLDPDKIEIIGEDDRIRLLGVKFFTQTNESDDAFGTMNELKQKLHLDVKY